MSKQNGSSKKSSSSRRKNSYPPRHITLAGIAIVIVAIVFALALLLAPLYPLPARSPQPSTTSTTS